VLGEDPFHGHSVGLVVIEPLLDPFFDPQEAGREFLVGQSANCPRSDHGEGGADSPVDHAYAAAGQPRIDSQYAHRSPVSRTFVRRAYPPRRPGGYPETRAPRTGRGVRERQSTNRAS